MKNNNSKSESSLRSFTTLAIVIASSLVLASCGGGDSTGSTTTDSLSADSPNARAMAVTGVTTVSTNWVARKPTVNTIGSIPYDATKVIHSAPNKDLSIGTVNNQFWISSATENCNSIEEKVLKINGLVIIAKRDLIGVLVQIDPNNYQSAKNQILKIIPDADVYNRVITGKGINPLNFTPNDGFSWSANNNSNWHLNKILIRGAWNYTMGDATQKIGVIDSDIDLKHEDLINKDITVLSESGFWNDLFSPKHANSVSGVIVGESNNGVGVSGINSKAKVIYAGTNPASDNDANFYKSIVDSGVVIVNNSWGPMGVWGFKEDLAYKTTRIYRAIAKNTPKVLHVWSAGNSSISASYTNGALHIDRDRPFSQPLENVIVVAASDSNDNLCQESADGATVDIAAPSHFRALAGRNLLGESQYTDDFGGTSAAAPIVSGVASLVMAANNLLSPKEVKDILIKTSTVNATYRKNKDGTAQKLDFPIPIINAEAAVKEAVRRKSLVACGSVTAPVIVGQTTPFTITAAQRVQFSTTATPKSGYPFGSYNWTTSDSSATLVNNGGTLADFVLNTAGTTTVTVTPVLADGTVCTSSAATAQVVVQPSVTPTLTPSLSISMDSASLATLGATDKGYISYISRATSGINKPAVSFIAGGSITIPHNANMEFTTGATFDLWARMDSLTGFALDGFTIVNDGTYTAALLAKSGPYAGAAFITNAFGNASIRTMDTAWWSGGCQSPTPTNIPPNTWHRVTYTMSVTGGMQAYVNKRLVWSCQSAGPSFLMMNNSNLMIGGVLYAWGPYTTPGTIADVKIYKSALTADQVSQLN